jgi:hypothetical protein
MAVVDTIINNALSVAFSKSALADSYTGIAIQHAGGYSRFTSPTIDGGDVREPNVAIPSRVDGIDTTVFDSMYAQIVEDLAGRFRDFLDDFFPDDQHLMPAVETWLKNAIENGGTGINANVERQIWQRDRDRISNESFSASDQAINQWAARGYPMPPGAAAATITAIARQRTEQVAAVSRDAAIKAFETEIENIRFAIAQAIDYRTKAIAAAADYIRALAVAPDIASKMSTQSADAQARLISAAASFYNARIGASELVAKVDMYNADNAMKAALANQSTDAEYTKLRVDAAVAAANSVGQQAAAALNGLNATSQLIESVG